MVASIFAITTLVCGIGWIKDHVGLLAVSKYLHDHDTIPSDEELRENCEFVVRRLLKLPSKL